VSQIPKASSPNKALSIPLNRKFLEQTKAVEARSSQCSLSFQWQRYLRTVQGRRLLIGSIGWAGVGFHGAKEFPGNGLEMLGQCLSTEAASKKGFISNEIDFFSVKPEFYRRR
jgi:hypothetical protein